MAKMIQSILTCGQAKRAMLLGMAVLASFGVLTSAAQAKPEKGKIIEDWGIVCEGEGKTEKCFAQQVQTSKEGGMLLTTAIGYIGAKNELTMVVLTPLGIALQNGVAYRVDDHPQASLSLQQCTQHGCQAVTLLSEATLKTMTTGKAMVVGMKPYGGTEPLLLPVSLKGLTAIMAALTK